MTNASGDNLQLIALPPSREAPVYTNMKVNDHRWSIGTSTALLQTLWTSIHKQNVMTMRSTESKMAVKTLPSLTDLLTRHGHCNSGGMPNKGIV
jgi:hypothetical protein